MLAAVLAAVSVAAQIMAAPADVTPQTRTAIAPVHEAIAEVQAEQARLPPPKDHAEAIRRLAQLDQAPRAALGTIDFSRIPAAERKNAGVAVWQEILRIDHANLAALMAMLPPEGWFMPDTYGAEASKGAFQIVQHSDEAHWRRFVPVLEPLARRGQIEGAQFALMYDRLALAEGRKQRYGSQVTCKAGAWIPQPIEDPDGVDRRRAELGMTTYAAYLATFIGPPPC